MFAPLFTAVIAGVCYLIESAAGDCFDCPDLAVLTVKLKPGVSNPSTSTLRPTASRPNLIFDTIS